MGTGKESEECYWAILQGKAVIGAGTVDLLDQLAGLGEKGQ